MSAPPSAPAAVAVAVPAPPAPDPVVGRGLHRFVVRYYRRMKPQRVYRMVVELGAASGSKSASIAPGDSVVIRPLVPGAQVAPAEGVLIPRGTGSKATFYVTPLAYGKLGDAKVIIQHQQSTLQEVRTPMKCVTQRFTWIMLLLTVAVPLLLYYVTITTNYASPGVLGVVPTAETDPLVRTPRMRGPVAQAIEQHVPEYEGYISRTAIDDVGKECQAYYDIVCLLAHGDMYLFHYIVAVMLILTIISAFLHRAARGKSKGVPITLPYSASLEPANPLAFGITGQPS